MRVIVLCDVELGGGTITDDFISDNALSGLILKLAKSDEKTELVFNGDTFDFLKCPSRLNPPEYPIKITPKVSLEKLKL
ncbi:hypothetical protein D6825_01845, partial [Candidatus Woesearchaeota archaeon]